MRRIRNMFEMVLVGVIAILSLMGMTLMIRASNLWSQEAAGWAQAIGTILAICGAVWVAERDARIRRDGEMAVARIASAEACSRVQKLRDTVEEAIVHLSKGSDGWLTADHLDKAIKTLDKRPQISISIVTQLAPLKNNCALTLAAAQGAIANGLEELRNIAPYDSNTPSSERRARGVAVSLIDSDLDLLRRQVKRLWDVTETLRTAAD